MRVGIVGAGNIGATLARKFSAAGHEVLLANSRGPDSIQTLSQEIGATAVTVEKAARDMDAVVLAVPTGSMFKLPERLLVDLPPYIPVIDTSNYFPGFRDPTIVAIEMGMPESEWVTVQLDRPVVKAFNSILAESLANKGRALGAPDRIALPVAGNNEAAKRTAIVLVNDAGFDGIDGGTLAESWRQQPGSPAFCTDLMADALRRALAAAIKQDLPRKRVIALQKRREAIQPMTSEETVGLFRSIF